MIEPLISCSKLKLFSPNFVYKFVRKKLLHRHQERHLGLMLDALFLVQVISSILLRARSF